MLIVALVVSLIANIYVIYVSVSTAVTLDHITNEEELQKYNARLAREVATKIIGKLEKNEIDQIVRASFKSCVIKWDANILYIDEVGLRFADGKLVQMVSLNEESSGVADR